MKRKRLRAHQRSRRCEAAARGRDAEQRGLARAAGYWATSVFERAGIRYESVRDLFYKRGWGSGYDYEHLYVEPWANILLTVLGPSFDDLNDAAPLLRIAQQDEGRRRDALAAAQLGAPATVLIAILQPEGEHAEL